MASTDLSSLYRAGGDAAARPPGAGGVSRNHALAGLKARIAAIEGEPVCRLENPDGGGRDQVARRSALALTSLGCPEADAALGGGFPTTGLSEIHLDETRDGGTLSGFAMALAIRFGARPGRPLLWIGDALAFAEAGLPYGPGLAGFGLDPAALCLVRTKRLEEAAWAAEEAAASPALAMAILEIRGNPARLGLEGTRRLHLRARAAGLPLLLLRQSARAEATAAPLRLRIRPGPAAPVADLAGERRLIGDPVFAVAVEKSRAGRPHDVLLEWKSDERRFDAAQPAAALSRRVAAETLDRPDPARADGAVLALRRTG
ncbi:ImuA family protein [Aurantimonas sp. HBX-1]|uniref:ImuA family protein n=1 Tax=Aurantimonas sp. HBX-1 TaxID=2906072 RepID=UPI001F3F20D4|nr:hypothetical protein [Aurantimonas sp. HBX-1]UIJ71908.1 hypothetical protein LXB15_19865 [Aurantimonas sp. HBX-1]